MIKKYRNRHTAEEVTAMLYTDVSEFDNLKDFIGDIYPSLTPSLTRIYEQHWVIRYADNTISFVCCKHGENCFQKSFEEV